MFNKIRCPYCREKVYKDATVCPYCNHDLAKNPIDETDNRLPCHPLLIAGALGLVAGGITALVWAILKERRHWEDDFMIE